MDATVVDPREALYAKGTALRPLETPYDKAQRQLELRAATMNVVDDVSTAIAGGANTAVNLYNDFERKTLAGDADPNWDAAAWLGANADRVPAEGQWRYMQTRNAAEAELLLSDYNAMAEENALLEKRGGFTSFTAQALAGLVDLDAPLALLSGGTALGIKGSLLGTRFGRVAVGAAAGGASNAALMTVDYGVNPHGDWTSIPTAALLGVGLGGFAGSISPKAFTQANAGLVDEFATSVEHGTPLTDKAVRNEFFEDVNPYGSPDAPVAEGRAPQVFTPPAEKPVGGVSPTRAAAPAGSSVGAAQLNAKPGWQGLVEDADELAIMENAVQRHKNEKLYDKFDEAWDRVESAAPGLAHAARVFDRAVSASPLGSVYAKLANSPSYVAKMLAHDLMVNPGGVAANARAGALLKVDYENQLRGIGIPAFVDSYNAWAAKQGKGVVERNMSRDLKAQFDNQVALELQARRYDAIYDPRKSDQHVVDAANAHDAWSKRELEINQGRPGEGSVLGWQDVKWEKGYMHQRWSGAKMNRLIAQGTATVDQMVDLLSRSYMKLHPGMELADAKIYARALVNRARTTDRGVNTNLIGLLQEDGTDYLRQTLQNNGVPDRDIARLIEQLTQRAKQKSQQGVSKRRIDVDLREKDASGLSLMDIVDTNLLDSMAQRSRGTSGRAALARKGIYSPQDRDRIIKTVLNEQLARKGQPTLGDNWREKLDGILWDEKDLTPEQLHDYFSFFGQGAIGGGISAGYSRAMKLTNLALLNGLGLTQLAETGPIIAAFGWEKFLHYAGDSLKSSLGKGDSPLVQELAHMHVFVPEHRLYRDDMTHELEKGSAQTEFWATVDHTLNQAQRMQGYMTGMYKVKEFQQRIAVTAAADKIMTFLGVYSEAGSMSAARLAELGLSEDLQRRLTAYIQNGTVEFKRGTSSATAAPAPKKKGFYQPPDPMATAGILNSDRMYLHKLNFDKWDPRDVEEFVAVLNLSTHRQVQKALAGESSMIFHKDGLVALFVHLKSFPLLAMTKQTMRHARVADSESIAALTYGLMTAGAVYTAKQALLGKGEETMDDPVKMMKGAFGMSNLTGWLPMFTDPLASMLGMDNLKFNEYSRGIDGNVITMPAAFPTLNKMANIPGALLSPITGAVGLRENGLDANAINALKATPLMGNYYGIPALLNIARDENRRFQREQKKEAKAREASGTPDLPNPIEALLF